MTIGISSLPNQRHKIVSRKGGLFTLMVVGQSGLGKSTFINTLFHTNLQQQQSTTVLNKTYKVNVTQCQLEEQGFTMKLNIIDTPGFGDYLTNQDCWIPAINFIDQQNLHFMNGKGEDLRVHCCIYFIAPTGNLSTLDITVMKELGSRVNLIPVIAKGDSISKAHLGQFKALILEAITQHEIKIYTPPMDDNDDNETFSIIQSIPFSIIGSTKEVKNANGQMVRGRQYLWGVAEVENESHCDFVALRKLLIRTHLYDLITSTDQVFYDEFRQHHQVPVGISSGHDSVSSTITITDQSLKQDEENLRKKFTEQVRLEEARFRKWEQNLISERDRLNKDLEDTHRQVKELEQEVEELMKQ